jgi:protein-S-isoprenylcysteine O-methyltransferase Ste14
MSAVIRTLIFTVFVPGFWTVALPYLILPSGARSALRGIRAAGWLLIAAGTALYFATAFWGLAVRGKGTPLPLDPPKRLVVEGPYRVVRNPMYWAVASVMLGEAAVFHSLALTEWAMGFFAVAALFVWVYEEPALQKTFGDEYDAYRRSVPRWLPRLRPRR